jgi:hypothetical protein
VPGTGSTLAPVTTSRRILGVLGVLSIAALAHTCSDRAPTSPPGNTRDALDQSPQAGLPPTARPDMVEELRRARDLPRHASDGGGRAWIDAQASSDARAGRTGRWTLVYEAGEAGIAEGGFVRLTVPRFWDWSAAQTTEPDAPGYTTAECLAKGLRLETRDAPGWWVDLVVRGRALASGEQIRIVYGAGPGGAVADRYAERDSRFWITVDGNGDGYGSVLASSPGVDVAPGAANHLSVLWPSTAEPGDEVLLRIAFLDASGSRGVEFEGEVELVGAPEGLDLPERVTLDAAMAGVTAVPVRVNGSGVFRVLARAADDEGEFLAASNPLLVEKGIAPVHWGDLHGHSNLSDGTGTPEDYLAYARDVAALDIIALTDHDHWGMLSLDEHPELWEHIRTVTEQAHEPGRFVTVLGYEWTNWIHGHRHVLYFGDDGPVLSSLDEATETPRGLWDALAGMPALTFAHHSAGGPVATNWKDFPPPPELEPVTEVASVHGSSEALDSPSRIYSPLAGNFVRDALGRGYRLGFVGSGDSHDGHPGLAHLAGPAMGGVAAILTADLTREGVRSALLARRCYATNGPRILLRAALDGHPMGSSVPAKPGQALLYTRAIACAPILRIELIRGAEVVETLEDGEHWDVETAFQPTDLEPGEFLYVRVVQEDGGTAWSSPFFVE